MSILIRNVQYPTSSPLTLIIYPDGTVSSVYDNQHGTAVPVPPHGRLIDADALDNTLGIDDRDDYVHWTLDDAPTIIPAEKSDG